MKFWQFAYEQLSKGQKLVLLYVINSQHSSPGRQGFRMMVGMDNYMYGSVGGGIMEHKLVELAKSLLHKESFAPFIKKQLHKTDEGHDRSGMICSGEQTIAFYLLKSNDTDTIKELVESHLNQESCALCLNEKGLQLIYNPLMDGRFHLEILSESQWLFKEIIGKQDQIFIVGGGHIGLALSRQMNILNFHVTIIDDRKDLNTIARNTYADKKIILSYDQIDQVIPSDPNTYIALVSFGYRSDKFIIKKLIGKKFKYFGVLGSENKMKKLEDELKREGFNETDLSKINTPIGINIRSKTPEEIAVSIAGEIVMIKNQESIAHGK